MVARHVQRYVVSCRSELDQVERILGGSAEPVVIEANSDSGVLSEIEDFRCLVASGRVAGVSISFASDDPLRRELARIVGLEVEEPRPMPSGVRRAIETNAPTRKIDRVTIAPPDTMPLGPAPTLSEALDQYTNHGEDESYASFSFVVNPPVPRRPQSQQDTWYDAVPAQRYTSGARSRRASRKIGRAAAVASVAVIALLVASGAILLALLVPQASITLVPTTSIISADVTYGIAGQSGAYDVTIEPAVVSGEVTFSETIPTTGVRSEPDGVSLGAILLTNPSTSDVFLPAGTMLTTAAGISFTTVEDVTVPPADPYGTATMGSAVTSIRAVDAGPGSNIPAQELSGQMDNGLFFSNREATHGGTMRDIAVVSQADIETLRESATQALAAQVPDGIERLIPAGHQMVEGSGISADLNLAFSLEPGMDGSEVSVEAVQAISAQVYDPSELQRLAADELNRKLTVAIPNENVLLADSISTSEPAGTVTGSGNPEYRMSASARTRAVFDPAVLEALQHDLVGSTEEEAASKVALLKGVAGFEIEYGPEWFPFDWPPRLESRIAITIDDSTAAQEASGTTGP